MRRLYAADLPATFLMDFFAVVFFMVSVPVTKVAATAFRTAVLDTSVFLFAVFNVMTDMV
jgi:hypothetical protein